MTVGVRVFVAVGLNVKVVGIGANVGSFVAVGNSIVIVIFFGTSGVYVGA